VAGDDSPAVLGRLGHYPPTPAMKRFADCLARQKSIKPPPDYKTSISICRKFLSEHAPKKADGETAEKLEPKPASPAQLLYAKKIAQGKGVVIPDEAKANSAAMAVWIDSNQGKQRRKSSRKTAFKPAGSISPQSTSPTKRSRKRKADAFSVPPTRSAKFRNRHAAANSLWQQRGRSKAWRPLWLDGMVCPAWS
jgi:DNA topoisomerase III